MEIYGIVKKYINEPDPDELLAIGAPDDEYDMESRMISRAITKDSSVTEIADVISPVFLRTMQRLSKVDVTKPENFLRIAEEISNALVTNYAEQDKQ